MKIMSQEISYIEVSIIEARLYQNNGEIAKNYFVTLIHHLTRFQTPVFSVKQGKIWFDNARSFCLECHINSKKKTSEPFLRIILNPTDPLQKFQAIINHQTLSPWINQSSFSKDQSSKRSFCLSYPLISKERNIIGQIKLSFRVLQHGEDSDFFQSCRPSLKLSDSKFKQIKKIYSNSQSDNFRPCVSNKISVVLMEPEIDYQVSRYDSFANQRNRHQNLQYCDFNEAQKPLNDEASSIQLQQNKALGQNDKVVNLQIGRKVSNSQSSEEKPLENDFNTIKMETKEQLPEDYLHLFQKITEINKKYAPLERIPSQEQLSQGTSFHQKEKEEESFYSLDSELSVEVDQKTNSLYQAQQFLKELNLYKFGQSLTLSSEINSQKS